MDHYRRLLCYRFWVTWTVNKLARHSPILSYQFLCRPFTPLSKNTKLIYSAVLFKWNIWQKTSFLTEWLVSTVSTRWVKFHGRGARIRIRFRCQGLQLRHCGQIGDPFMQGNWRVCYSASPEMIPTLGFLPVQGKCCHLQIERIPREVV